MARALLRRPQLLLLDEVTSQLDAVNELALRETITRVKEHCTLIVVAHRLSTVRTADQIVVMEAGRGPLRRRRGSSGRASHLTRRERLRLVI